MSSLVAESQDPTEPLRRVEQMVDQMLSDSPDAAGPLNDDQIKYMLHTGLQKIIKIMFNRRSRYVVDDSSLRALILGSIDMPWWTRVFAKILEVSIYGISFDNASLISCALDIFDETKSSWFRINHTYGTSDAPVDANPNEEVWATVRLKFPSHTVAIRLCQLAYTSQRSAYYPYHFTKLVNHFGSHDGFAYIIGRVKKTDPKVSVPILRDLIRIFTRVRCYSM